MLLEATLESSAARRPDAVALVVDDARLTYAELDARANRLARALYERGVRRGDRVALWLENSVDTVVAIFGVLKAGAAFMPVNATTKEAKLGFLLQNSEARGLILQERRRAQVAGIAPPVTLGVGSEEWTAILRDGSAERPPASAIDLDLAALLYTSGSTGEPKGVMLTHANVTTAIDAIVRYLALTERDVLMNVLPLSFGYGLTQLFSAFQVGARFVLTNGMPFPHLTLTQLGAEKVTGIAIVPTIAAVLLNLDLAKYDLASLRYLTNAGAALPSELLKRLRGALPGTAVVCMYGQTECLRVTYLEPSELDARPGSVGRGMPNQELWLVDDEGRELEGAGTGELVVRGGHVMRGYWRLPEETARKLKPGRLAGELVLHSGDVFRRDADGYLYFVTRKDEIIKSRGEKVAPREVENCLYSLEGVAEAAVIGVPDPVFGQAVKAVVVPRPGVTLTVRQVQRHVAMNLEDYMVPSQVEFRDALPKTTTGKIAKGELK